MLQDAGLSCFEYVEQLTLLLFLKMADQLTRPPYEREPLVPPEPGWPALLRLDGAALEAQYRKSLDALGGATGMLGVIFRGARCEIHNPSLLKQLIVNLLDEVDWMSLPVDVKVTPSTKSWWRVRWGRLPVHRAHAPDLGRQLHAFHQVHPQRSQLVLVQLAAVAVQHMPIGVAEEPAGAGRRIADAVLRRELHHFAHRLHHRSRREVLPGATLPKPAVLATEIAEDLQKAQALFAGIAERLADGR